jgi:AcrR family transcriptional regulator
MLDANLARVKMKPDSKVERRRKQKEYHHGDLRRAVLEGAFAEVRKRGLRELTLREVARQIGVTHAAPYHHFKDLSALLDAMAEQAFDELDQAMLASKRGLSAPDQQLHALGRCYIDFAREHPERIEVMFRRAVSQHPAAEAELGHRSFQHLVDAVSACQAQGLAPAGDPFDLALSAWSLVHGFAALFGEGPLGSMQPYRGRFEPLRERVLGDFIAGLKASAR